jgi:zinc protease
LNFMLAIILGGLFSLHTGSIAVPDASSPAPAPTSAAAAQTDTTVSETLANGMHVVVLPNNLAPVATTIMSYGVGSDDDTISGVAHATEHMLFRGTTTVSAGQLADIAARMGAEYNAFTGDESTVYFFKLPSAYVGLALQIEADRMTNATIRESDWATERGAIEQEIRAQESQPGYKIGQKLRSVFFQGTPFANATGGTIQAFNLMTSADIRAFYKKWYHPANATLFVAGNVDPQKTLAQIRTLFEAIPNVATPVRPPIVVPPLAGTTIQDTIDFPIGFGVLACRLPGSTDQDYAASLVLSRVFQSGRGALADLAAQGKLLGAFSIANSFPEAGANFLLAIPKRGDGPQAAQDLVASVLDGYRKDGVPSDLIAAAKTRLLSEQAYSQASISGLGFSWADAAEKRLGNPAVLYAAIDRVTDDDVNRVMRTYFAPERQVSVIITGKPTGTTSKADPSAGVENVSFTPTVHEALPVWAANALKAPLVAPQDDASIESHVLLNGLHLLVRPESTAKAVVVSAVIRTSPPLYEPKGKDGVSLILAGMLPLGTVTLDRTAYQTQLDSIAASVTLGTTFGLKTPSNQFDRAMQLLADGMLHPAFSPKDFEVVKAGVLESVSVDNALPATRADLAERMALYPPGDPHRRDVTVKTVSSITLDDVKRYYQFSYRPDETEIAIVGDVTQAQALSIVNKYFGSWFASGAPPSFRYPTIPQSRTRATSVTLKSAENTQSQVTLKQVVDMRRSDVDYVPLLLANTILSGEGTGSMLMQDLRRRHGYVYSVDSRIDPGPTGMEFTISFASDPANVDHAEAAALSIIRGLQRNPLPVVELQRAKAMLLAQRTLPLDSYSGVAADLLAGADEGYVNNGKSAWFWRALVETTPAQLQHAMKRIDAAHFARVIVAPGN